MKLAEVTHEGFLIIGDPRFPALKLIRPKGQGSVPKDLRGVYTSFQAAKDHVDIFLAQKKREADATKDNTAARSKSVRKGTNNRSVAA